MTGAVSIIIKLIVLSTATERVDSHFSTQFELLRFLLTAFRQQSTKHGGILERLGAAVGRWISIEDCFVDCVFIELSTCC